MSRFHPLRALALLCAAAPVQAQNAPIAAQNAPDPLARIPVSSRPLKVRFPKPQRFRLPNGMLLVVVEDHRLPAVTMALRVRAGSFSEPANRPGLAALTAAMLDEGTRARSSARIAAEVDAMGASLGAGAEQGGENAVVSADGLSEHTPRLLDLLADITLRPTFPAAPFARVRRQLVADRVQAGQDPGTLAEAAAMQAVYGNAPPARVLAGVGALKALTPADLRAFHARTYRPEQAVLGVAGDVDVNALRRAVARLFGPWKPGGAPAAPPLSVTRPRASRVLLVDRPGSVQTVLRLTNLGIRRNSPDDAAVQVMNHILGDTYTSRIWVNIRETRGFAYDIGTRFLTPRHTGVWYAGGEVRNAVTGDTLKELFAEFRRIQDEPVSAGELAGAKGSLIGRFARRLESPASLLTAALDVIEYGLPANYWDTYPARIQAVTAADVRRVARAYIGAEGLQIVAVGQRSDIESALAAYGPVQVVDPLRGLR